MFGFQNPTIPTVKVVEEPTPVIEPVIELKAEKGPVINPHGDPLCAGCGGPVNTVTIKEDGKVWHGIDCYNK